MLNFFKKKNLKDFEKKQEFDIKLIGLVLAYEIASSDGNVSDEELKLILAQIKKYSEESSKDENELLHLIKKYHEDSVSFNEFINEINSNFLNDEKILLVKFLWEVAYADNLLELNEERLIRRIADLINLRDIKVLKLKNDAKKNN